MRKELWRRIQTTIREERARDKPFMIEEGEVPPHLHVYRICIECNKMLHVVVGYATKEMNHIRQSFPAVLQKFLFTPLEELTCPKCKSITFPLGYSWYSLGWALSISPSEEKEFQLYLDVIGTVSHHPAHIEVYLTATSTMIGKKKTITSKIHRKINRIISFDKDEEAEGGEGIFQVSLPQYNEKFYEKLRKVKAYN